MEVSQINSHTSTNTERPSKEYIESKMRNTTVTVGQAVLFSLAGYGFMNETSQSLVQKINVKHTAISALDDRTNRFFQKMMVPIKLQVDGIDELFKSKNGRDVINPVFVRLQAETKEPEFKEKYIQAYALDPIKELYNEFEATHKSIVTDIIAPDANEGS